MNTARSLPRLRTRRSPGRIVIAAAAALFALLLVVRTAVMLWTDELWFRDVGQVDTWYRMLSAKLALGLTATALVFAVASVVVHLVERAAPAEMPTSRSDAGFVIRAYAAIHPNLTRTVLAGFAAITMGPVAASSWKSWTLYRYGSDARRPSYAPFGRTLGFYLFRLPFLRAVGSWLLGTTVMVLLVAVLSMLLYGSLRIGGRSVLTREAGRLLSVIIGVAFVFRAVVFWLGRYALAFQRGSHFDGASYVDLRLRAPALVAMSMVSMVCAGLMFANARRVSWRMPIAVIGSWLVVAMLTLFVVPQIGQRIALSNESLKERPSIERTIAATRDAFQLNDVQTVRPALVANDAASDETPTPSVDDATLANIRVWDAKDRVSAAAFNSLQHLFAYFQIVSVDADRQVVDGKVVPRLIAVREQKPNPSDSWVNQRLTYTHGFGVVTADSSASVNGEPRFVARALPPVGTPSLREPRVYFGEKSSDYVIVDSNHAEVDFGAGGRAPTYTGTSGIELRSTMRRLAFAVRLGDLNVLLSNALTSKSRVLWTRQFRDRARRIAPFLHYDSDPLPVVYKGRLLWVLEAYTASSSFPNADRSVVFHDGAIGSRVSYARNSARVIVDAYTGTTRIFRIDGTDPIVAAYAEAFPNLFEARAIDEVFPGLRTMLRVPRDLFNVRASLWGRYHSNDSELYYSDSNRWVVGQSLAGEQSEGSTPLQTKPTPVEYAVSDPLNTGVQEFVAQQLLVARGASTQRPEDQRLRSVVIGRSDPRHYGQLVSLEVPGTDFESAASAAAVFKSVPEIADRETNMGRGQSTAVSGEMQVARVGDAFAYVRPFYVESENSNKPLLRFVEVLYRGRTGFAPTVAEAFSQAAGRVVAGRRTSGNGTGSAGGSSGSGAGGPGDGGVVDPNATQSELVAQAAEAFDAAQQALANGDLGTYQRKIDEAGALVHRANEANEANEAGALVNETATPSRSPTSAVPAPAPTTTSPPTSASAGAAAPADGAAPAEATTTSVTATKALSVSVTNNP